MNYRHQYHAGNFADVLKHAVLLHLLRAMQAKEKGFVYIDTHAGRGGYDLAAAGSGTSLARTPEWPDGIGRLLGRADLPPELENYLAAVRAFDARVREKNAADVAASSAPAGAEREGAQPPAALDAPRFYPGSPRLAQGVLRAQDRAMLFERQPEEAAALAAEFAGLRRISVQAQDGYVGVRAALPPPERRALVLIDPPFESQDEWSNIAGALSEGLRRLPGGVFAVWYPLTARAKVDAFYRQVLAIPALPPCYTAELVIGGEGSGLKLWGCGVLVLNPPWGSAAPLDALSRWLATVLGRAEGAAGGVHWLVRET